MKTTKLTILGYEHKAPEGYKFDSLTSDGSWVIAEFCKWKESNLLKEGILTHRLRYYINDHGVRVATAEYEL